jgi:hypothetical protein
MRIADEICAIELFAKYATEVVCEWINSNSFYWQQCLMVNSKLATPCSLIEANSVSCLVCRVEDSADDQGITTRGGDRFADYDRRTYSQPSRVGEFERRGDRSRNAYRGGALSAGNGLRAGGLRVSPQYLGYPRTGCDRAALRECHERRDLHSAQQERRATNSARADPARRWVALVRATCQR